MSALVARVMQQRLTWCTASRSACVVLAYVSQSGGSEDGCRVLAPVARVMKQGDLHGVCLGAGVDAGVAASNRVVGCQLRLLG